MDFRNPPSSQQPREPLKADSAGPVSEALYTQSQEAAGPQGLGGWLGLVGLGLVVSPVYLLVTLGPTFAEAFSPESWDSLTNPDSAIYHPHWAPLLITELAANALMILAKLYLLFLFFTKRKLFPKIFIIVMGITPVFIYLDAFWGTRIINEALAGIGQTPEPVLDADTMKELTRALGYAFIWIPYMLISKRVKNTFINPRDDSLSRDF